MIYGSYGMYAINSIPPELVAESRDRVSDSFRYKRESAKYMATVLGSVAKKNRTPQQDWALNSALRLLEEWFDEEDDTRPKKHCPQDNSGERPSCDENAFFFRPRLEGGVGPI